jgi:HrpA-like RNA helicase
MEANELPAFLTTDITEVLLSMVIKETYPNWGGEITEDLDPEGRFDPLLLDLMDSPSVDSIEYSMEKLFVLGLVDADIVPTLTGLACKKFMRLSLENSCMLLAGYKHGANVADLITIAAFMQIDKRNYVDGRTRVKESMLKILDDLKIGTSVTRQTIYMRLLGGDFVMSVLIWQAFMNQIKISRKIKCVTKLKDWCVERGLIYKGLLAISDIRDEILEAMIQSVGLDPKYNGLGLDTYNLTRLIRSDINTGVEEIKKIKQCVYEGYRMNVATLTDGRFYKDGSAINIISDFIKSQEKPQRVVYQSALLRKNPLTSRYGLECDRISVLDGFILPDDTFISA